MKVQDFCKLCNKFDFICESHIWPRFYYIHWLYDINNKYVTDTGEYKCKQDKKYLFCEKCEGKLRDLETIAKPFFDQFKKSNGPFEYSDWLLKFVTSLTFRYMLLNNRSFDSRKIWKQYLMGERNNIGNFGHNIYFINGPTAKVLHGSITNIYGGNMLVLQSGPMLTVSPIDKIMVNKIGKTNMWNRSKTTYLKEKGIAICKENIQDIDIPFEISHHLYLEGQDLIKTIKSPYRQKKLKRLRNQRK